MERHATNNRHSETVRRTAEAITKIQASEGATPISSEQVGEAIASQVKMEKDAETK